ncbi:MAG: CinA family nicotinamide mononucleotide deamidase-related protein [Planctomycetota bacterium]
MASRRVAILSVGDELVLGQIADTNARWIAIELQGIGCLPGERRTVADERSALAAALRELAASHDAVVVTGGLGPTLDDLTREALLDVVDAGRGLVLDDAGVEHLRGWFERRGRPMPESNLRQAMRPPSARLLDNPNGTAPGIAAAAKGTPIFCLPGPPGEMQPMFGRFVAPAVADRARVVLSAALHTIGMGESVLAERLGELMERGRSPSVGTTASDGVVTIRVRSEGAPDEARAALEETVRCCEERAGSIVFARDGGSLAAVVGSLLAARRLVLATAESCTGGLVGAAITEVAGSSAWYAGGFVTYANERKRADLGVPATTLDAFGAVSHETAIAMARGCLARTGASIAIATTGVAGPGGGSDAKPVGTVFVAVAIAGRSAWSRRFHFPGDRATVRKRTENLALACARFALLDEPMRPLLWSESEAVRVEAC